MRDLTKWLAGVGCLLALPMLAAAADGPTFDCAKAHGEVEKLICSDASLAALDRKLAEAYKAASAKATGKMLSTLKAEQRGWVKGRDDCWKTSAETPTWISATWTVSSVKDCVAAQYEIRTSELQAVWRLVQPKTVSYACQNNPANEVVANFFATEPPTIRLERGDRTVTLWQIPAGGGKYEGQNVSLVHDGDTVQVSWLNVATGSTDELACKAR